MPVNNQYQTERCNILARKIRTDCIKMTYNQGADGAHIGGALSLADIMAVLYGYVLRLSDDSSKDKLILSKGHGAMAQYAAMFETGLINQEDILSFKTNNTFLYAHPCYSPEHGIDFSGGSLGQGLSFAVGCSLGLKRKKNFKSKIYVIMGDGECDEGSVWEAAQSAVNFNCSNIIAIIDDNHMQYDGSTDDVMKIEPFEEKWNSFGWSTEVVNGHDVNELYEAIAKSSERPVAIIANTIKGKGVSFMENNPIWHNHSLTEEQYHQALVDIETA